MHKAELLEKIKEEKYTHSQLLGWVGAMPGSAHFKKPQTLKSGDVFMHPIFKHPYILLKKRGNEWICGLITTEETCEEVLEPCVSRFFNGSFITKVLFSSSCIVGSFLGVYENSKQLKEVYNKLKEIL